MAETITPNNAEKPKASAEKHEALALPTAEQAEPLRKHEADPTLQLQEARINVNETARSETQPNPVEALQEAEKAAEPATPRTINRELKQITVARELLHIRRKLPAPQRALSRVVHQPVVRVVSEAAGKTVSRPSGLLGGSLVAFLGTSGYLYLAKQVGLTYNYLVFLVLLAGGFAVGLLLELLVHLVTRSARGSHD